MTETPLDIAHASMQASDADTDRLRFFDRFATAELFLLLESAPNGDQISPRLFDVEGQSLALVFDTEDRLSDLAGAAPYAALSGRQLVAMISGQSLGVGLNLGVAQSSFVFDPDAISWLAQTLSGTPTEGEAKPVDLTAPVGLPNQLLEALDARLAASAGLARSAYLCAVTYDDASKGHLLAFIDAAPAAQEALAKSISEALTFSGIEAGALDIAFFEASDEMAGRLARVGLRFDLPEPSTPAERAAPGSDPNRPPILRN